MKIIGVTGGIGSGKSTVTKMLHEEFGLSVIDADRISKEVSQKECVLQEIKDVFGKECINQDMTLNRKHLAEIIFSDEKEKAKLNQIIHPRVLKEFKKQTKQLCDKGEIMVVYDCPLLFEEKLEDTVDLTLVVYAEKEKRIDRIRKRDQLTEDEIKKRINAQMPLEDKIPLADYVIYNSGDIEDLRKAVHFFYKDITNDDSEF